MLKIECRGSEIYVDCDIFTYHRQGDAATFKAKYEVGNKEYLNAILDIADSLDKCFCNFGSDLLAAELSISNIAKQLKDLTSTEINKGENIE